MAIRDVAARPAVMVKAKSKQGNFEAAATALDCRVAVKGKKCCGETVRRGIWVRCSTEWGVGDRQSSRM